MPFEFAQVVLPSLGGDCRFKVFAPQHAYLGPADAQPPDDQAVHTLSPFALDPTAKYFRVLVALCEPRLRGTTSSAVPGVGEVVERLRGEPDGRDVSCGRQPAASPARAR